MSKNQLTQNYITDTDSIFIRISFTDGDGDFGNNSKDTSKVYLVDQRTGFEYSYRIPDAQASGTRGIEGEIKIKTGAVCCIFPDGDVPCTPRSDYPVDTLIYDIYILDLAGNKSNVVQSDPIFVLCN